MLGIESSCDETAAAIVGADKTIHANEIASQIETHSKHGGVVPEVAARAHLEMIDQVIRAALATAGLTMGDIDAVAATGGPGLIWRSCRWHCHRQGDCRCKADSLFCG